MTITSPGSSINITDLVANLEESINAQNPELFISYLDWAASVNDARGKSVNELKDYLQVIDDMYKHSHPANTYETVSVYLAAGLLSLQKPDLFPASFLNEDNPLLSFAKEYLSALLAGNRNRAQVIVDELIIAGCSIESIYEHVFQASQYEVGLLWQKNKITVAHEHYCTAATQLMMGSLYPHIFSSEKKGFKMLACTVSGSLHELGVRMLSDLFELNGWDTYYMGADLPDADIISAIKEQRADLLAISVIITAHLGNAERLIRKIRNDPAVSSLKIVVGGHPFILAPDLWKKIGADGSAINGKEAVVLANTLMNSSE